MAKVNFNTLVPHAQSVIDQKILVAAIDAQKHNQRSAYFKNYRQELARDEDDDDALGRGGRRARKLSPPITNRGGKSHNLQLASYEALEKLDFVSLGRSGQFKTVATPKAHLSANVTHSFIDWVNFTFKTTNLPEPIKNNTGQPDMECVHILSALLFDVFGYGVTGQRPSGMNFYEKSFDLGTNGWGLVCIGGQNDTCSVTVKGQGLLSSKPGWEKRLFDLLNKIPDAKLTRVDLASDNFNSKLTVDDYLSMYHADRFTSRGRRPNVEQAGNWVYPNGKGRTLYVGNRKSGKLLRIYEKGLQLANGFHEKYPNWLRVELELKNQDRVIPYEVLLKPGQYLAGAYPALVDLHKTQSVIETFKKTVKSTFEKSIATTRHQYGKHIWTQVQILGMEKTIELLTVGKNEIPKTLNFDTFEQFNESNYMHNDDLNNFLIPVPF